MQPNPPALPRHLLRTKAHPRARQAPGLAALGEAGGGLGGVGGEVLGGGPAVLQVVRDGMLEVLEMYLGGNLRRLTRL